MPTAPEPTFDSVVLASVVREVQALLPLRVLRAESVGPHEVALVGRAASLLFSADPRWARVHLWRGRARAAPHPFADLVRARLSGARLVQVHHVPFERVAEFHFEAADGAWRLVAEPMGKHGNLVLVHDGRVVGVARPVPPERSRVRPLLPGLPYEPPPPDLRPRPGELEPAALWEALRASPEPLWRAVLRCVAGIGPLASYEAASRTGDPEDPGCDLDRAVLLCRVLAELRDAVHAGAFAPHLYLRAGEPVSFAPFPLTCLERVEAVEVTMSEAVERVLDARARSARFLERRARLAARVRVHLSRKRSALEQVRRDLGATEELDRLREAGRLLLAYAHQVPVGARSAELPGQDGRTLHIPLDPSRTAVENAQALFRRYAKLRAALRTLPSRAAALEEEVRQLEALEVHLETARAEEDLSAVEAELPDPVRRVPRGVQAVAEPRRFLVQGFVVLVGRSNRDNDRVTFRLSSPDDLWFHARGLPGAHVVLRRGGRAPSEDTVRRVAALAAYYSAGRGAAAVDVDYTERRNVWKPRRAPAGRVLYRGERTVRVAPAPPEEVTG